MADDIKKIKDELLDLNRRYNELKGIENLSMDSSLAELMKLIAEEEKPKSTDIQNNMKVFVEEETDGVGSFGGMLNNSTCRFLLFPRRVEAQKAFDQFQESSDCFVRPICVVEHMEKIYLAVEPFVMVNYNQGPSHTRNNMIKYILKIAIHLDMTNQFNDGFGKLVIVNGMPKLITLSDRKVGVLKQASEIQKIINKIVKEGCEDERFRKDFFYKLEKAFTMTDLHNSFYHPFLMTGSERIFYHPRCMLVMHFSSGRFNHKWNLGTKWQSQPTWITLVENSGCEGLNNVLEYRTYNITHFEWHQFVRNSYNHVNDNPVMKKDGKVGVPYYDLYEMSKDLDDLFPDLHIAMHNYMSKCRLYDDYEGRETRDTIQLSIYSKMQKLTADLPTIPFVDFLEFIDIIDFVLGKISISCRNSSAMESIRNTIMTYKKQVNGFVGNKTLSDVNEKAKKERDTKDALNGLKRYLIFFTECLCQLEIHHTKTLQLVVTEAIVDCCGLNAATGQKKAKLCGLPDRSVVENILQSKVVPDKEHKSFMNKVEALRDQLLI